MSSSHRQTLFSDHAGVVWSLARRELKARYRSSWLGFLWTFVDPIVTMAIFYFIFTVVFRHDYPEYLLYLMSGMLPFFFFNQALVKVTNSMITYSPLIRQIYCPREVFVFVGILSELYQFMFAMLAMIPLYFFYSHLPGFKMLAIVPTTLLLTLLILGLGLLTSVINVFIRDITYLINHILRLWFYLTPIFYTFTMIQNLPAPLLFIYRLNPLVPILETYRWALMTNEPFPHLPSLGIACIEIIILNLAGVLLFRRLDNSMVKML